MGYWLKSFNADPPPVPGKSYTVAQINNCEFDFGSFIQSHITNSFKSTSSYDRCSYRDGIDLGLAV